MLKFLTISLILTFLISKSFQVRFILGHSQSFYGNDSNQDVKMIQEKFERKMELLDKTLAEIDFTKKTPKGAKRKSRYFYLPDGSEQKEEITKIDIHKGDVPDENTRKEIEKLIRDDEEIKKLIGMKNKQA